MLTRRLFLRQALALGASAGTAALLTQLTGCAPEPAPAATNVPPTIRPPSASSASPFMPTATPTTAPSAIPVTAAPTAAPTSPPPTGVPTTVPPAGASPTRTDGMKLRLILEDTVLTATLIDSRTTQDFVSLLPLTLTMNDLYRREKYARLPRAISAEGKPTLTYAVGDVAYWSPGPDVAIFYRHDGQAIPDPGVIIIGKIDAGVEALNVPGSLRVTIELMR